MLTKRWERLKTKPSEIDRLKPLARLELTADQAQRALKMDAASVSGNPTCCSRRHAELAGIGLGKADEVGDGFHRQRIIDIQNLIAAAEGGDRSNFAGEIDGAIERGVDHVVR
jgi:hypothetical protein